MRVRSGRTCISVEPVAGGGQERGVDRDDLALTKELVLGDILDTCFKN